MAGHRDKCSVQGLGPLPPLAARLLAYVAGPSLCKGWACQAAVASVCHRSQSNTPAASAAQRRPGWSKRQVLDLDRASPGCHQGSQTGYGRQPDPASQDHGPQRQRGTRPGEPATTSRWRTRGCRCRRGFRRRRWAGRRRRLNRRGRRTAQVDGLKAGGPLWRRLAGHAVELKDDGATLEAGCRRRQALRYVHGVAAA